MNIRTLPNPFNQETHKNEEEIKGKVVRKAALARQILKKGGENVRLFDLKQSRENPERTVFIFRDDEKFQQVFSEVLEDNRKDRDKFGKQEVTELRTELEEMKKKFAEIEKMTASVNAEKE